MTEYYSLLGQSTVPDDDDYNDDDDPVDPGSILSILLIYDLFCASLGGRVAQLVEQLATDWKVRGSIPGSGHWVFHICADGRKISFLCPNGTIFRQSHLICDWWWTVDCASSKEHYEESAELLANDRKIYQARSDALSKSRARQRGNRKPGIIREFEGASASVTSYSTEPSPRNARIQIHSKVINPSKQLASSTPRPGNNENIFSNPAFSRSSEEFPAGSSMEQAEQRAFHAFHPPFPETRTRRPFTGQLSENRQTSQSRQIAESRALPQENDQYRDVSQFTQNIPPAPGAPEQRQFSQSRQFSEFRSPPRITPVPRHPPVTTHRPQSGQFLQNRPFEQTRPFEQNVPFQQNIPERQLSQSRQVSQSRFVQSRQDSQLQGLQNLHPPPQQQQQQLQQQKQQRQSQFRPETQSLSQNKEDNSKNKTYSHIRFFSAGDGERQLPAETGSFVTNRGNQLLKQSPSSRSSKPRITPVPQNRFPQATTKSYVELDRSRTTTKPPSKSLKVALSQRVKPFVVRVTDRGLTGLSDKSQDENADIPTSTDESTTGETPFDDDDDDDGFPEPPSDEQFKDEDLFYLRSTSTESVSNDAAASTELPKKRDDSDSFVLKDGDEQSDVDLDEELSLSKPSSDVQFKDEDLRRRPEKTETRDRADSIESVETTSQDPQTTKTFVSESTSVDYSSAAISTKKSHRFRTPTTSTTTIPTTFESRLIQHIIVSSTLEPPTWKPFTDEEIIVIRGTTKHDAARKDSDGKDEITKTPVSLSSTATPRPPTSEVTSQSTISSTSTESAAKKLRPIFVEIISRGSSEPPQLKAFTVEELERLKDSTEPTVSKAERTTTTSSTSSETETTTELFRSRTTSASIKDEITTLAPTSQPSRRVKPPARENKKLNSTIPKSDEKPSKVTTSIPPTTLYVTLSRRVQPPVLILSSIDPRDNKNMKTNQTSSEPSSKRKEPFRTRTKSPTTINTTPIIPVTISRRVQPPIFQLSNNNSISSEGKEKQSTTRAEAREPSESLKIESSGRLQTLIIDADQPPLEADDDLLNSTESPTSSSLDTTIFNPTKKSTTYVEIQRRRTTTMSPSTETSSSGTQFTAGNEIHLSSQKQETTISSTESTTASSNISVEIENSVRELVTADPEIPKPLPLKQEPTPNPSQYGNRDGLEIPVSSGPSTLHSLAVYFATKDSDQETTKPTFDNESEFGSKKIIGKEKTTTSTVSVASSTVKPDSENLTVSPSTNDTDMPVVAPSFLTKSTRDSYSALFPDTKPQENIITKLTTTTEEIPISTSRPVEKTGRRIKTMDRKPSDSSHNVLKTELLDKLAEISQMETTPHSVKLASSSTRDRMRTDTEDLLEGTDSRDLRELAQIFSRALSAYLEDPEEFKKVLTEVRPKDPSLFDNNETKKYDFIQHKSTTTTPVSTGTTRSVTSPSTEFSSVTQEEDEVLDFSDVSKVSRRKPKSTTVSPIFAKSTKLPKRKSQTSSPSTLTDKKQEVLSSTPSSRQTTVTEVTTQPSHNDMPTVDSKVENLQPPMERLKDAQTSYYALSFNRRPSNGRIIASSETVKSKSELNDEGTDYTLPPGTKQYSGPGYGPQSGDTNFAPTAGGVNDPSRPRYGGFQNNSKTSKSATRKENVNRNANAQEIVAATTLVPGIRYQTKPTTKTVNTTPRTATSSDYTTKDIPEALGNILNTFVPEDVNNLAIVNSSSDAINNSSKADESKETGKKNSAATRNVKLDSNEELIGANTASFSSSRISQPSNQLSARRKWSTPANIVDALTINRELSASNIEERASTEQELVSPTATTQTPRSTTKAAFKSRSRSTTTITTPEPTVSLEDIHISSTIISSKPAEVVTTVTPQKEAEIISKSGGRDIYVSQNEDLSDTSKSEEVQPSNIPDITFYSEKIKPPPPSSASLIRENVQNKDKTKSLADSVISKYNSEEFSESKEIVDKPQMITASTETTLLSQTTLTSSQSTTKSTSQRKISSKSRTALSARQSENTEQSSISVEKSNKKSTSSARTSSPELSTSPPFSETTFVSPSTLQTTTITRKHQLKLFDVSFSEPDDSTEYVTKDYTTVTPTRTSVITSSRRPKSTTKKPTSSEEGSDLDILKEDFSKKDVVILNSSQSIGSTLPPPRGTVQSLINTGTQQNFRTVNNEALTVNSRTIATERKSASSTLVKSSEKIIPAQSPTIPTFAKIRMSSDPTPTSATRTGIDDDLKLEDVTSDQLQALEDLQTMLFPANTTMAEDGTMFGNLNQSSTLSLINTMKQAVTNSTVRRLVLLLVNSLKDNTPEEARTLLIEALLRMPVDRDVSESQQSSISASQQRVEPLPDKSSRSIVKDVRVNEAKDKSSLTVQKDDSQEKYASKDTASEVKFTTTQQPTTTFRVRGRKNPQTSTTVTEPTTTTRSKGRKPVRLRTTTEVPQTESSITSSLEGDSDFEDIAKEGDSLPQSDTRAVELLRSLYTLASRWG
ncbi:hypothetical protein ANN_24589 [Periplaneta americana]|uniref:Chitin-binding type-2 domain-containing protein n=1 Tax=Periplaneta americana TaxID=6978 RepID=A0ABQ8S3R1_PERAM|nr:hypothetical protein ANN_24589 [Periplaneta americana]